MKCYSLKHGAGKSVLRGTNSNKFLRNYYQNISEDAVEYGARMPRSNVNIFDNFSKLQ